MTGGFRPENFNKRFENESSTQWAKFLVGFDDCVTAMLMIMFLNKTKSN